SGAERRPCRAVHRHVEQGQQRRSRGFERAIAREESRRDLFPNLPGIVPIRDLEEALEEVDHRQVPRRFALPEGGAFENAPTLEGLGLDKFVNEPRLAHSRLTHDSNDLSVTATGELLRAVELLELRVPAHEPREPSPSRRLQTGSRE